MTDFIKATYHRLISELNITTYRYLYKEFNINNRLTGLVGPRGSGKTTLLLQYIKNNLYKNNQVFYFSADNVFFNSSSLLEFIANLYHTEAISVFFIDEIHKYQNWQQELKNIYDAFPKIKIVFSGSSSIDLVQGSHDLSRRTKLFKLAGLSLREYINFILKTNFAPITFKELISNYRKYDGLLAEIPKISGLFRSYLKTGYYPFIFEDENSYSEKVLRIIEKTIYEDITNYYNLKTSGLNYFRRMLSFLATTLPGNISINNLAHNLGIDFKTAENYLQILTASGLVRLIYAAVTGNKILRKPEKAYLHNTTLLYTLAGVLPVQDMTGLLRELFFVQSFIDANLNIFYSSCGDFQVENCVFEIGGKNKQRKQIQNIKQKHAFLVKDHILVSNNNEIPLYYFGFLY